ncbi:hypothetical protein QQG74_09220 [Micromonospora sp. FIMYZ51]|uniref:hypothetical protein n=1 Tax=Micromonospora sp. FIMYZ51 TaxID=3051832 RepID=UPI0031200E3D
MTAPEPTSTASMHRLGDDAWIVVVDGCNHTIGPDTMTKVDAAMHEHIATCPDLPGNQNTWPAAANEGDGDDDSAASELHTLIVRKVHAADCGCTSEVHPNEPDRWDYYHRIADAVMPLFGARWQYGARHLGDTDSVFEQDDLDDAVEFMRALGWEGSPLRRLQVRHVGEWTETAVDR